MKIIMKYRRLKPHLFKGKIIELARALITQETININQEGSYLGIIFLTEIMTRTFHKNNSNSIDLNSDKLHKTTSR